MIAPIKLYGSRISYYTGKMEGYLRYKEIPFEFVVLNPGLTRMLRDKTGAGQMPAVELANGRIMTDTTPMIQWFEGTYPNPPVIPHDPVQRFFSLFLEDYAEEWLWRPAMHYRWSYKQDRLLLSRKIVDELLHALPAPSFIKRASIRRRQWGKYVRADGVDPNTWDHVESIYLNTLDRLETVFRARPYLFGHQPTIADFGFFASMFRHFGQDPTASEIMRRQAPGVFEWQARVWNARASKTDGELTSDIPDDLDPLLEDAGVAYLPYLNANARAWQQGHERFDPIVQGVQYSTVPVSQYRVWCLEQLQHHAKTVPEDLQSTLQARLQKTGCWNPLFEIDSPDSRYDEEAEVPFRGRKVHYHNRRS